MRIVFTADIHWDISPHASDYWIPVIEEIKNLSPDVLVIGGDIAAKINAFDEALRYFSAIQCQKCYILGNHDVWITQDGDFGNNSFAKYEYLCNVGQKYGFHCLESAPLIVGDVGLVGNCGWYDYSFRDKEVDIFYPLSLISYKRKKFPNGKISWRDGQFAKWGIGDDEVSQFFSKKLSNHILQLEDSVKTIAYFSHHIPIGKMVKKGDMNWNMGNAFSGSILFEKLVFSHQKIKYIFCGHSHTFFDAKIKGRFCYNVGVDYLKPGYKEIDV